MIEQSIIQVAPPSRETFDGTKSKFQVWTESIKSAVQISGQKAIHIAFSKLRGSPLSIANRLKTSSPNLTWAGLKRDLSMQNSIFPSDIHVIQA